MIQCAAHSDVAAVDCVVDVSSTLQLEFRLLPLQQFRL